MKTFFAFLLCAILLFGTAAAFRGFGPAQVKAMCRVIVEEFNRARKWDRDLQAAVAASASLAELKIKIAALPARPDITADQVRDQLEAATEQISANLKTDPDLQWMTEQP